MTLEKWSNLTLFEQLSNIGGEIKRALESDEHGEFYLDKARRLIDLTAQDPKSRGVAVELYDELAEAKKCLNGIEYADYDYIMRYWGQFDNALAVLGPRKDRNKRSLVASPKSANP